MSVHGGNTEEIAFIIATLTFSFNPTGFIFAEKSIISFEFNLYFLAKLDDVYNYIPARLSGYFIFISSFALGLDYKNLKKIHLLLLLYL